MGCICIHFVAMARLRSISSPTSPIKRKSRSPSRSKGSKSPTQDLSRLSTESEDSLRDNKSRYSGIDSAKSGYEFGGPIGVSFLMVWSHYILLYFW